MGLRGAEVLQLTRDDLRDLFPAAKNYRKRKELHQTLTDLNGSKAQDEGEIDIVRPEVQLNRGILCTINVPTSDLLLRQNERGLIESNLRNRLIRDLYAALQASVGGLDPNREALVAGAKKITDAYPSLKDRPGTSS